MATSLKLSDVSSAGIRSGTAIQAGTYTFNTKDKYNNANIAFTVPTATATINSPTASATTWSNSGSTGKISVTVSGTTSATGTITKSNSNANGGWVTGISSKDGTFSVSHDFTDANFTAANIKLNTTIFGIKGTLDYISTHSSVPTTKDTSIIKVGSTYYLWR